MSDAHSPSTSSDDELRNVAARQHDLDRRQFLLASGGLAAGAPLLIKLGGGTDMARQKPSRDAPLEVLPEQTCDLTVRWRHLVERVSDTTVTAAWPMDEGAGYAMTDISGNGHDLYITGSAWNTTSSGLTGSFRRFGRRGGGVFLDGTQWLQGRHHASFNVADSGITLSAWVRPEVLPTDRATVIAHGDAYTVQITPNGAVSVGVRTTNGQTRAVETPADAVRGGRWSHLAITVNPSNGELRVFVNNRVSGEASGAAFSVAASTDDLRVGDGLHGVVDEVAMHDHVLGAPALRRGYLVGLPKVYTQSRETLDADRTEWTRFKGTDPIPHPVESDTAFGVRFDGDGRSIDGANPVRGEISIVPGHFGGALQAASGTGVVYASPLSSNTGTFEAWYKTIHDAADPDRITRKELFRAEGADGWLSLYTEDGRWKAELGAGNSSAAAIEGPQQTFVTGLVEHVAVTWGDDALVLFINGSEMGRATLDQTPAVFDQRLTVGGAEDPAFCQVDDVHVSDRVREWGDICPRGHASTDTAGLDLRDSYHRASGTGPMWWRPGTADAQWKHADKSWEDPGQTGDSPVSARALRQGNGQGLQPAYHPDAYGNASSIEAGVSFDATSDGWAGVFVQAEAPGGTFAGHTFMINPGGGQLRLARYADGAVAESKVVDYDFPTQAETTYELTLTASGGDLLRGFVDGHNLISMQLPAGARTNGYAGLLTHDAPAYFDDVHFSALTPAAADSRKVQLRVFTTGDDVAAATVELTPFRWHKRRGLPPWQYVSQGVEPGNPELAGNIAGADTAEPERPIAPAFWRFEDSANSDLITVDGRVIYFMRGNPRVDGHAYGARIGVLDTTVDRFDGVHFDDPSRGITDLDQCKLVRGRDDPLYPDLQSRTPHLQVNNSGSAYVGGGRVLVFMNEMRGAVGDYPAYRVLAYAYYDAEANDWINRLTQYVDWSTMDPDDPNAERSGLIGTPELVALRDAETDDYQVILFHLSADDAGIQAMTTTGLALDSEGVPQLDPQLPSVRTISRSGTDSNGTDRATKAIYNFRVLFDNGIYYLHYSEGPRVPDWPTHFPLCAALDPYAGPWVRNVDTNADDATYFTRGDQFEPDNAAIWQGCMFKHRGRYYQYYENFHAIDDIDAPYQFYDHPHVGSRVGYAVAN